MQSFFELTLNHIREPLLSVPSIKFGNRTSISNSWTLRLDLIFHNKQKVGVHVNYA